MRTFINPRKFRKPNKFNKPLSVRQWFNKYIGYIFSTGLAMLSIYLINVNTEALEIQNETAAKSERNERFKNAIDQLADEKNSIVLGGIYTLHRIANEDESYIENVFNILCAFVRDTTSSDNYQNKYKEKPSETIQAILNILCVNKEYLKVYRTPESKLIIDFSNTYLVGAYLDEANLTGATLGNANLTGADLSSANLTYAKLEYANLEYANLSIANLRIAILNNANLTGANLSSANLENIFLSSANLTGATLGNANLTGATLGNANLTGADLSSANLTGANLIAVNLLNASLNSANLTGANLIAVNLTGANLWYANLRNADLSYANLTGANLWYANLTNADLKNSDLRGAYSSNPIYEPFEKCIKLKVNKQTDLSGIKGGYYPKNPPFKGEPIFGAYTEEEAEEIIKKYYEDKKK